MGGLVGSVGASVCMEYFTPFHGYGLSSIFAAIYTLCALFVSDEIETNEQALQAFEMERLEILKIQKEKGLAPSETADTSHSSLWQLLVIKFHIVKDSFKHKELQRLAIFFVLQGLLMPSFSDFAFAFAIKVQKLTKMQVSMSILMAMTTAIIWPFLYNKFFIKKESRSIYNLAQVLVFFASLMCYV